MWQGASQILGLIFHPSYMMINAVILGKYKPDPSCESMTIKARNANNKCLTNTEYLAAFGIGSATVSIFVFAAGMCYAMGLSALIP